MHHAVQTAPYHHAATGQNFCAGIYVANYHHMPGMVYGAPGTQRLLHQRRHADARLQLCRSSGRHACRSFRKLRLQAQRLRSLLRQARLAQYCRQVNFQVAKLVAQAPKVGRLHLAFAHLQNNARTAKELIFLLHACVQRRLQVCPCARGQRDEQTLLYSFDCN